MLLGYQNLWSRVDNEFHEFMVNLEVAGENGLLICLQIVLNKGNYSLLAKNLK